MDMEKKKNEYNNTIKFQVTTILKSSFCEMINNIWLRKIQMSTYCTIAYHKLYYVSHQVSNVSVSFNNIKLTLFGHPWKRIAY